MAYNPTIPVNSRLLSQCHARGMVYQHSSVSLYTVQNDTREGHIRGLQ